MAAPARFAICLIVCTAGVLARPGEAEAQAESREARALLGELREHQARFERVRRNHLPWAWGGGGGACDERIGRFCLNHGSGDDDWEPEPEEPRVTAARDALLEALAAGSARLPADDWIQGQRVRYLVEAERLDDAIRAAGSCRAEPWWCRALAGFALHHAGRPADADTAFSSAIRLMPEAERDRWTDLSPLLDPCSIRHYRRLTPRERAGFESRFWRLADPFITRAGNETRAEHLTRQVWDRLQDRAASVEGIAWGEDLREILIRYGIPQGWERVREDSWGAGPPAMVTHYAGSDRDLLPPCEVLLDRDFLAGEWDQEPPMPRTGYRLPMPDSAMEWVGGMDFQVAVFQRGDSAVVVVAYEIPEDSIPADARVEAGVALLTPELEVAGRAAFEPGGHQGIVTVGAPAGPLLMTMEAVALEARRAGRVRYGIDVARPPPGLLGISDLLLLRGADPLPDSLTDAVPRARRSTRVRPGERVGVYWEIYGLTPRRDEEVTMSLRLLEQEGGWIRDLGRRLGLIDRAPPTLVRWREPVGGDGVLARSATIAVPEALRAGHYTLELTVAARGREPLAIRRVLTVEPGL